MSEPTRWKRYGKYGLEWDTYIPDHIASATIRYTGTKWTWSASTGFNAVDGGDTTWFAKAREEAEASINKLLPRIPRSGSNVPSLEVLKRRTDKASEEISEFLEWRERSS